jgi:hypothetical protein
MELKKTLSGNYAGELMLTMLEVGVGTKRPRTLVISSDLVILPRRFLKLLRSYYGTVYYIPSILVI